MTRRLAVVSRAVAGVALAAVLISQNAPHAQTSPRLVPPQLFSLVRSARQDINAYWAARLQNYRPPVDVVMIQAPTDTDCGHVEKPNAMYCGATHKIYWDVALLAGLYRLGDYAPVFVLAHEWGHLAQSHLGLLRTASGLLDIQHELQADCFAGAYTRDATARKVADPGDDDEAILAIRRAGDDLDTPWFTQQAHGTSGQRLDAFSYGFDGRSCTDPAFWEFLRQRGIDPARAPQTTGPQSGGLEQYLPNRAGRFTLTAVKRDQEPAAIDAFSAVYKTPDGIAVNAGFLIYVADSSGYAGSVALLVLRNFGGVQLARFTSVGGALERFGPAWGRTIEHEGLDERARRTIRTGRKKSKAFFPSKQASDTTWWKCSPSRSCARRPCESARIRPQDIPSFSPAYSQTTHNLSTPAPRQRPIPCRVALPRPSRPSRIRNRSGTT